MLRARVCSEPRRARSRFSSPSALVSRSESDESSSATFETSGRAGDGARDLAEPPLEAPALGLESERLGITLRQASSSMHASDGAESPVVGASRSSSSCSQHGGGSRVTGSRLSSRPEPAVMGRAAHLRGPGPIGLDVPAGAGNTGVRRACPRKHGRRGPRRGRPLLAVSRLDRRRRADRRSSRASIGRSHVPHVEPRRVGRGRTRPRHRRGRLLAQRVVCPSCPPRTRSSP